MQGSVSHFPWACLLKSNKDKRENLFSLPPGDKTRNIRLKWQLLYVKAIKIMRDIVGTQDPNPGDFSETVTSLKCLEQSCPYLRAVGGLLEGTFYPITYDSIVFIFLPFPQCYRSALQSQYPTPSHRIYKTLSLWQLYKVLYCCEALGRTGGPLFEAIGISTAPIVRDLPFPW